MFSRLACSVLVLLVALPSARAQEAAPAEASQAVPLTEPATASADQGAPHVHVIEGAQSSALPTIGPANAPVTIEYFLNLSNTLSGRIHRSLVELAKRHPRRLRVVYRLTETREQSTNLAQTFGQEAFEQGRFFEFLDAYYGEAQRYPQSKDYPDVAAAAGLNYQRVVDAIENMRHDDVLAANHFYWRRMRVATVPGILINGKEVPRNAGLETLESLYDAAYLEVQNMLAKGVAADQVYERLVQIEIDAEARPRFSGVLDGEPIDDPPRVPMAVSMAPLLRGTHRKGPEDAKVPLVFICHLQSLLCRTMSRQLESILMAYPSEVRLIFHALFDDEQPGQDRARLMHEAALCADEQGAFWEYYEHAFDHQQRLNFDQSLAIELAASPALDLQMDSFESCLESGRQAERVEEELELVRKAGVAHTPALAIGGLLYSGRLHFDDIRWLVDNELRAGIFESAARP